ncbi:MAG: DUF6353 family protein [Candidatus Coprovivens sp.]
MKKEGISKIINHVKTSVSQHSPEILTGLGITGMLSATVLAVKATPKALRLIEDKKEEENVDELTTKDVIKTCWRCYIPTAITTGVSVACLIGATSVNSKRNAVLATAYKLSENAFTEYKEKVIETIGEKKEQEVRDKVAKEKIEKNPVKNNEVIITEKGNTLCYDAISGRYFKSDIDKIRKAENIINKKLMNDMYCSLNEFYDLVGLPYTQLGFELGWNVNDSLVEIEFSTQLSEDDTPCIVVDYSVSPKYNYQHLL